MVSMHFYKHDSFKSIVKESSDEQQFVGKEFRRRKCLGSPLQSKDLKLVESTGIIQKTKLLGHATNSAFLIDT